MSCRHVNREISKRIYVIKACWLLLVFLTAAAEWGDALQAIHGLRRWRTIRWKGLGQKPPMISNVSNLVVLGVLGVLRCVWFQCWRKRKQDSPAEQLPAGSPIANLVDWKLKHRVFLLRWCCYWIRHMFEASDPNTGQMYVNHRKSIRLHPPF